MIRDTFFSLHRFVNVCRKEMVENWKTYILRSVMVYGMLAIVFVWNGYYQYHNLEAGAVGRDPIWEFESRFFLWGLVIWGCISASFAMERMKSKTSRTVVLMTPATMFEKFFARWLVATCGFILVFLIAFKLADLTRVVFYLLAYPELHVVHSFPLWEFCCNTNCFYETIGSGPAVVGIFLSCYFFLQSFFLLGSTVWPKNALIKTFAAGVCIFVSYILIAVLCLKAILPNNFFMTEPYIDREASGGWLIFITSFFALFNWVLAYFRFKESEIINRW